MAEFICEEIWVHIFKRLSVKYLLRCRSVQKSWYHLIQTPYFISVHSNFRIKSAENKHLLFHSPFKNFLSLRYDNTQCKEFHRPVPEFLGANWRPYGASNGLLCLSTHHLLHDSDIYLWNPLIGKFKTLPKFATHFDSPPLQIYLGFGYSSKLDDYKVVKIIIYNGTGKVDVYSMKSNSWKTLNEDNMVGFAGLILRHKTVILEDAIFWTGGCVDDQKIVYFDMEHEILREMSVPNYSFPWDHDVFIYVVGGKLVLLIYDRYEYILDIWVREGDIIDGVWTNKGSLKLKHEWYPIGFRNNGKIVLKKLKKPGFVSFEIEKFKENTQFADDSKKLWFCGNYLDLFTDSLIFLDDQ